MQYETCHLTAHYHILKSDWNELSHKSNISQQPEMNPYDTLFLILDFEEGEEDEFIKFRIFQLAQYQYYYVEMLDL